LKVLCYRNYCVDFNQIWHNDTDHQVVIVSGPNRRPTNPRWRAAAILKKKPLNRHISATVRPILMKFGMVTHIGPLQGIVRKNFEFLKIQDGGCRHLENHKKIAISPQRFRTIEIESEPMAVERVSPA